MSSTWSRHGGVKELALLAALLSSFSVKYITLYPDHCQSNDSFMSASTHTHHEVCDGSGPGYDRGPNSCFTDDDDDAIVETLWHVSHAD